MIESQNLWLLAAALPAAGALAGFMSGLLGVGGGIVLVPSLFYIMQALGFSETILMHMAVGTSLAVIVPTGFVSARAHWRREAVLPDILRSLGPGVLAGALAGTVIAGFVSGHALQIVFAAAISLLALVMSTDPGRFALGKAMPGQPWKGAAGLFIGALSTLLGIGGATISVPYMTLYGVPMHKAVGTAAALGLAISVPAALGFSFIGWDAAGRPPLSLGYINLAAWIVLVPFSMLAAPHGARAAHTLRVGSLRRVFAIFMTIVAIRMIYGVLH